MASGASRLALGALLGALVAGCGGEADPAPTSPTSPAATEEAPDLDRYLLQADEVPGLTPVSSPTSSSAEPFDLPAGGAERLARDGYVLMVYQPAEGSTSAGVSSVMLFETETGARDWMAYETSGKVIRHQIPHVTIKRFRVPEIPGAQGWTGPDLHGNAIGHVFWTQGSCMMLVGLEVEGPRVARLSAGARAIYERTGGTCPE